MAQQTTNLHLTKPDLTDFADIRVLNGNFDILDEKVQECLDKDPDLSGLMPKTGGDFTGDITVNGKAPQYELQRLIDDSNADYTLTAIKYSNGVLTQVIAFKKVSAGPDVVTFLIPFKDTKNISMATGTISYATDEHKDPYNDWVWSVANLSTTGATFKASGYYSKPCYTVNGYWR